jgi:predicted Fe-Mo cluster-binding NifX family protein
MDGGKGMAKAKTDKERESDWPKLAAPARRALAGAGYVRLEQLAAVREAEVLALHGMGPNAMKTLKEAMAEKGLSFADSSGG